MAKRAFQAVVLFFAVCGFLFVPLGKRTAIEHLQAIAGTPAARQAATELKSGIVRLFDRLRARASEETSEPESEPLDEEPSDDPETRPRQRLAPRRVRDGKPRAPVRSPPATAAQAPR